MRASYIQTFLSWIDELPEPERKRARDLIGAQRWERICDASPLAWLSMRDQLDVDAALLATLGPDEYRRGCGRLAQQLLGRPLFAPITRGRLVQGHPERLLHRFPLAWTLALRDMGSVRVEDTEGGVVVELRDLPTLARHDEGFLVGLIGTLEGITAACGAEPEVVVDDSRRGLGLLRLTLRWRLTSRLSPMK